MDLPNDGDDLIIILSPFFGLHIFVMAEAFQVYGSI